MSTLSNSKYFKEYTEVVKTYVFTDIESAHKVLNLWTAALDRMANMPPTEGELLERVVEETEVECVSARDSHSAYRVFPKVLCQKRGKGYYTHRFLMTSKDHKFIATTGKWELKGAKAGYKYPHNADPTQYLDFKSLTTEKEGKYESGLPYLGVELEFQTRDPDRHDETLVQISTELGTDFAIIKHDGTTGTYGAEIATAPATLAYHQTGDVVNGTGWNAFFEKVAKKLKSWDAATDGNPACCGMHVHISRDAFFSPMHLAKMYAFYNLPENKEFITKIAGRNSDRYADVAMKNPLAIRMLHKGNKEVSATPLSAFLFPAMNGQDKYQAVNLQKADTVEVRIFRGNVSKIGFFKNLEFVHAVFEYSKIARYNKPDAREVASTKVKETATGIKLPMYGLNYKDFISWLDKENNFRYKHLKLWLNKNGTKVGTTKVVTKDKEKIILEKMKGKKPLYLLTDTEVNQVA